MVALFYFSKDLELVLGTKLESVVLHTSGIGSHLQLGQ
jgi:hypothetical protein